jgi:hypothetical protein
MEKTMKKMLTLLFALATTTAYAQDVNSFIEMLRSDVKTEKRAIITAAMEFTEQQAAAFWPVYRDYELELDKLGDARFALIKDYAENFETMTDVKAQELTEKSLKFQQDRLKIKEKYFKKFAKVMPVPMAAKFMQLDNQMQLLIDMQIASELPLVKMPDSKN